MSLRDTIREKLMASLRPASLSVEDESALHAGHAGSRPGGETHFRIRIVSEAFVGMSRVSRQRHVYDLLSEEMRSRIHALSLETLTQDEAASH